MADKKVVVDLLVNSANSANSIKEMNKALKDLKDAQASVQHGSADWKKLSNAINETEGKVGDLNDSFNTLRGSGVERLKTSIGLFKEGLFSFDFGKIGIALKGLGAAFKAVLPFAIIEGVAYLVENWKELSEGSGVLAKTLQAVSAAFSSVYEWVEDLFSTDAGKEVNKITRSVEALTEANKKAAEASQEALNQQISDFDRQAKAAKAAGKSTIDIEKAKQQAIIDTNLAIAKQIEAEVRAGAVLDDERKKRLTGALNAIKDAKVTQFEITKNEENKVKEANKKSNDEYLKNLEEKKKADDQARKEKYQKDQEFLMQSLKDEEYLRAQDELDKKKRMDDADALAQYEADKLNYSAQIQEDVSANEKKNNDKLEQDKKDAIDAGFRHAQLVTQNLQAISDVAFSLRSSKVKKGSAEEEALMKRQFEVNKKLQVAQTVISTITGAREAYKSLATIPIVGPGLGIAAAAAATLAGLSAIQKINSTKFEGATAPTPDSGGGGIGSVGASNNAPSTTNAPSTQPFTKLDESGRNQSMPTVKAYVVESEMTDSQKRVGRLESQASF